MVDKNKTQNKLGDPKRVIKICLFLSMPKGPPAPMATEKCPEWSDIHRITNR